MNAKQIVTQLCVKWEGVVLKPYMCPALVPTIGVGSTKYEDGRRVTLKDPAITVERAHQLLHHHLDTEVFPHLARLAPVPMTEGQRAALADFIYNMGWPAFASSTLRKRVLAGQWGDVPAQLRRWTYAGKVQLKGLKARREDEIKCLDL